MNNKIGNEEKEVTKTIELNERDYLQSVLELEKNMSNNLSIAIDEASNDVLYDKFYNMFDEVKDKARDAFNLMFKNGWYTLEQASLENKNLEIENLTTKIKELDE